MPSPTSIQALVLRKAAEQQLGSAHALDTNILPMGHPEGLQSLLSGQISGHLTSPPFQFEEQAQGAHIVLKSSSVFGQTMFNGVFLTNSFYAQNTKFAEALYKDVADAVNKLKSDPAGSASVLSAQAGGKMSAADFQKYLTNPAIQFTVTPHGLAKLATFMKQIGITKKTPGSWKDLVFATAQGAGGS